MPPEPDWEALRADLERAAATLPPGARLVVFDALGRILEASHLETTRHGL